MVDIVYCYEEDAKGLFNKDTDVDKKNNFIDTIKINKALYSIDYSGYIYPDISVSGKNYLDTLFYLLRDVKKDSLKEGPKEFSIIVYTDVPEISSGDIFKAYAINDIDPHDYCYGIFWEYQGSHKTANSSKISLVHSLSTCPVCGSKLEENLVAQETGLVELSHIKRCVNSLCRSHVYISIARYLTILLKLGNYLPMLTRLIANNIINSPLDLYKLNYDKLLSVGISEEDSDIILKDILSTKGQIKLSDYLLALPFIEYTHKNFGINKRRIDVLFGGNPCEFVYWLQDMGKPYLNEIDYENDLSIPKYRDMRDYSSDNKPLESRRYNIWKDRNYRNILSVLSEDAFFQYYIYFNSDINIGILQEMVSEGIFKSDVNSIFTITKS